jgi:hypothetical protein
LAGNVNLIHYLNLRRSQKRYYFLKIGPGGKIGVTFHRKGLGEFRAVLGFSG